MTKPEINLESFEPKFETAYSHLDPLSAITKQVLIHKEPLTIGQFGQELHPVIYPSGLNGSFKYTVTLAVNHETT